MQKQVQETGVRKWFGDDFINLQNELYKAVESGILGDNTGIVSGVKRTEDNGDYTFSPGIVMIDGVLHSFEGHTSQNATIYLVPDVSHTQRGYLSGDIKDVAIKYGTSVEYSQPINGDYIKCDETTKNRFFILKTDNDNKFSDAFNNIIRSFLNEIYAINPESAFSLIPNALYASPHPLGAPVYKRNVLGDYVLRGYYNGTLPTPQQGGDGFVDFLDLPAVLNSVNLCIREVKNDGSILQRRLRFSGGKIQIEHLSTPHIELDLSSIPIFR